MIEKNNGISDNAEDKTTLSVNKIGYGGVERVGDFVKTDFGYIPKEEFDEKANDYKKYLIAKDLKARALSMRSSLILALVSLILAFFGLGLPCAVIALILACMRSSVKNSQTLTWAKNLSIISIIINVLMLISMFLIIVLP